MKQVDQGYIYLTLSNVDNHWKWIGVKTNRDGKWMSTFEGNQTEKPLQERLNSFVRWIGNVEGYRIVAYGHEDYNLFFSEVERNHSNIFPRYLIRIMKAQLWNIKSECMYRFQICENVSLEELLFFYRQDYLCYPEQLMKECLNLVSLTNSFLFDKKQTMKLMKKDKRPILIEIFNNYSTERLLFLLSKQGISVEITAQEQGSMKLLAKQEQEVLKEVVSEKFHKGLVEIVVELYSLKRKK